MADKTLYYGTGRRKSAVARVWISEGNKHYVVNGRDSRAYLQNDQLQIMIESPLEVVGLQDKYRVKATVLGGGLAGQASAIRLGISRALVEFDETLRTKLRRAGYLTRDPREKERKKPGRKGARRSFQFTKR